VKLTVDCVLHHDLASLQSGSALSRLLAKGKVTAIAMPLEALVCQQFGLNAEGDLPFASICAAADGLDVGEANWLRADPVHFEMQRDCFSLSEPAPLLVKPEHATLMIASLNHHFAQDGLLFYIGQSGAWYLRADKTALITTTLPSVAMDKNVHHFMPQGPDSVIWKAILNEVQMLLHVQQANESREAAGEVAVNSVWISGGGGMPKFKGLSHDFDLIITDVILNQGLAKWVNIPNQSVPASFDALLKKNAKHVRLQLPQYSHSDETWFEAIFLALKNKQIEQLTLNLGFYEKTLVVVIKPLDIYKFWRKSKAVMNYLN
jgi:hypothetical protein